MMDEDGFGPDRHELDVIARNNRGQVTREQLYMLARAHNDFDRAIKALSKYCDRRNIKLVGRPGL